MGGKNHQPCRNYLRISTMMSRAASVAYEQLERANIALEDVLLAELDGGSGSLGPMLDHLHESMCAITKLKSEISALRQEMVTQNYVDLPPLRVMDSSRHGSALQAQGAVQLDAWNEVSALMKDKSFYAVLDTINDLAGVLTVQTKALAQKASELMAIALAGELNFVLEENRAGNFKLEFARLYTTWGKFNSVFLASSILSTELWYAFTRRGSLLPEPVLSAVA